MTIAQLGGTTTGGDCFVALREALAPPWRDRRGTVARFEELLAARAGCEHAVALGTARVGLHTTLALLGVGSGDEVLVPVPTHVVVPNAIRYLGARPVFVDCEPATVNIDVADARRKLSSRTRALVLQHTFGIPAAIEEAQALAEEANLEIIEDCVHALGGSWHGRRLGSLGRAAIFSTEETKVISTTIGGAVTTDDGDLARRLREQRERFAWPSRRQQAQWMSKLIVYHYLTWPGVHGPARRLYEGVGRRQPLSRPVSPDEMRGVRPPGYERRMGTAQARIGVRQLERLGANLAHRRRIAARYAERLAGTGWHQAVPADSEPTFLRYPVLVADRDRAARALRRLVVPGTWFTSVLGEATDPAVVGYESGSCPVAEAFTNHLLNLPTHGWVSLAHADAIAAAMRPHLLREVPLGVGPDNAR